MATTSPLGRPGDIYRPFTRQETEQLRDFVADVRRLAKMSFFQQVPHTASWGWSEEGGESAEMVEPDDEAVRAAITLFRQLYSANEPSSYANAIKILKRSVHEHDGPERDAALADLDGHLASAKAAINAGIGMGITFDHGDKQRDVKPRDIVDAYFHGHYLHSRNDKSKLAQQLDELQPWPRYTLYTVMLQLRNVYWVAANAVDRVLAEPTLVTV